MLYSSVKSTFQPVTSVFSAKPIFRPSSPPICTPSVVFSPTPQHRNATKISPIVFIHLQNAFCETLLLSHSYEIPRGVPPLRPKILVLPSFQFGILPGSVLQLVPRPNSAIIPGWHSHHHRG